MSSTRPAPPDERTGRGQLKRYTSFLTILYPDCVEHTAMFNYLTQHENIFQCAWVLHDKDVEDAPPADSSLPVSLKKPHWHILFKARKPSTAQSWEKFFAAFKPKKIFGCESVQASLLYFIHDTPSSLNKHQYSVDELHGCPDLISLVSQPTVTQFSEALELLDGCEGDMLTFLKSCSSSGPAGAILLENVQRFQNLFVCAANQIKRDTYYHLRTRKDS